MIELPPHFFSRTGTIQRLHLGDLPEVDKEIPEVSLVNSVRTATGQQFGFHDFHPILDINRAIAGFKARLGSLSHLLLETPDEAGTPILVWTDRGYHSIKIRNGHFYGKRGNFPEELVNLDLR